MGIGMNFICKCCHYDTGILMLNQGMNDSVQKMIEKYIHSYTEEIDLPMLDLRRKQYKEILKFIDGEVERETIYNYDACVCYGCKRSYELLDILQRKEEQVYAGETGYSTGQHNPLSGMFHFSNEDWCSLLGDSPSCLFCHMPVVKITEERLMEGLDCPKCKFGLLKPGDDFEVWE